MKRGTAQGMVVAIVLAGFSLLLVCGVASAAKKPVMLRLTVPTPAGSYPITFHAADLAKRFNERAKGEYKIEVYPIGALAKMPEFLDAVRVGAVEMACCDWAIYSFLDPKLEAPSTPFLVDTLEGSQYMSKKLLPLYDEILRTKFNARALGMFGTDGIQLVSTKPVTSLAEWKGFLAGSGSPGTSALFKALGAAPVTIVYTDLYESLQKKVVDGAAIPCHAALDLNFMDVCGHMTVFFGHASWNGYMVNQNVWKKMPKDIQTILQEEVTKTSLLMDKAMTDLEQQDLKALKEKGKKVHFIPKAEREKWAALLGPYKDKQLESFGDFGRKVREIAEEANKKFPYKDRVAAQ